MDFTWSVSFRNHNVRDMKYNYLREAYSTAELMNKLHVVRLLIDNSMYSLSWMLAEITITTLHRPSLHHHSPSSLSITPLHPPCSPLSVVYPKFLFFADSNSGRRANNRNVALPDRVEWLCEWCPLRFPTVAYLNWHLRVSHRAELPYECLFCTKLFPCVWSRQIHMVMQHPHE